MVDEYWIENYVVEIGAPAELISVDCKVLVSSDQAADSAG